MTCKCCANDNIDHSLLPNVFKVQHMLLIIATYIHKHVITNETLFISAKPTLMTSIINPANLIANLLQHYYTQQEISVGDSNIHMLSE